MEKNKTKLICFLILFLSIATYLGWHFYQDWEHEKMLVTVQEHAKIAGLSDVSIDVYELDRRQIFLRCTNFDQLEWDVLLFMHSKIEKVPGLDGIVYSNNYKTKNWRHFIIYTDENRIHAYNDKGDIDYYGSWENAKKPFHISTDQIKANLEEKENKRNNTSVDRTTDAKICAQKVVEDNLKSPSTAKFCKYAEMTAVNLGGNRWKITGYVDAQNSFGATLRENWTVTLTLTTSGFTDATVIFQ